jgi:tetratricopeptide (TPR) repeat protein
MRFGHLGRVLVLAVALFATRATADDGPGSPLDSWVVAAGSTDEGARRAAAKSLESLGADALDAVVTRIANARKQESPSVVRALLAAHDPQRATDATESLVHTPPSVPGATDALLAECFVHALAHLGTARAVRELAIASADFGGALRPEIAQLVRALGDHAVAGLIRARRGTPPKVARWALSELETMNRKVPGDCVQTKDSEVLGDVLRAFGEIRDPDALGVVLSFANADRDAIRSASRDAIVAYGEEATARLRDAYAELTARPAPPGWTAPDAARELFLAYDRLRLQEVDALVDAGFGRQREGALDQAVADFDTALARQPQLEGRSDMAAAYVLYALSIEERDPESAMASLRKALSLAPSGPRTAQAESELLYLEGEALRAHGVVDADLFRRASLIDPANTRARDAVDRIELGASDRRARLERMTALGGGFAALVCGIVMLAGGRRRKKGR